MHLRVHTLSRQERYEVACVARRAGLPQMTLRLLASIVRPPPKHVVTATDEEKAEYGAALVRIGATKEGIELLKSLDGEKLPQVYLYLSHAHFSRWEYEESIPVLQKYLKCPLSEYQQIIGQLNLVSAYVHERRSAEAIPLLDSLEESTKRLKLEALHGNTLERRAELAIYDRDWKMAERCLQMAEESVRNSGGLDLFFVEKWRTILSLLQDPGKNLDGIIELRRKAVERSHWETVRECDAFRAIVCQDRDLLHKVYFGTAFPGYRERLLQDYGPSADVPPSFNWGIGNGSQYKILHPLFQGSRDLKQGQLKYRLLRTLITDFYRPFRVAHLFSEVYPGERFHILYSRARIHEGIKELKKWLHSKKLPFKITEQGGAYQFTHLNSESAIVIPGAAWWARYQLRDLEQIEKQAGEKPFGAAELAKWLSIPRRTAFQRIQQGMEAGVFEKTGAGSKSKYYLKKLAG